MYTVPNALQASAAYRDSRTDGYAGPEGNGLAARVAVNIRSMSTDSDHEHLQIPAHAWGIWPKSAKLPVPFRHDEAKVHFP